MIKKLIKQYNELGITAKATIWFVFCNIIQKALLIITTPIFTRLLTVEQYGQYTMYTTWLQIFTIITTLKLNAGGFNKAMSKFPERRDDYIATLQGMTTFLTIIVFCIYVLLRNPINSIIEMSTLVTSAMMIELIFSPAISFWTIRQRYEYKYKTVVFVTVLIAVCNSLLGVAAVLITSVEKGTARILSCVVVQVVFGGLIYIRNYCAAKKKFSFELAKYALSFSIVLLPHYLSVYMLEQLDRIMIQKMCGISYAAMYGVAYSAGLLLKIVTESITNALIPWMYEKLKIKDVQSIQKKFAPLFYSIILMLSIFIAFAPDIIVILAGSQYNEAVYVIPPVTASIFFIFIYTIFANTEFFYEAKKFTLYISMGGAILNLILNYALIPIYGFIVAGYTTLACYVAFTVGHFIFAQRLAIKNTGMQIFKPREIIVPSIIMIAVCAGISMLYGNIVIRYILISFMLVGVLLKRKYFINLLKQIKN